MMVAQRSDGGQALRPSGPWSVRISPLPLSAKYGSCRRPHGGGVPTAPLVPVSHPWSGSDTTPPAGRLCVARVPGDSLRSMARRTPESSSAAAGRAVPSTGETANCGRLGAGNDSQGRVTGVLLVWTASSASSRGRGRGRCSSSSAGGSWNNREVAAVRPNAAAGPSMSERRSCQIHQMGRTRV